MLFFAMRKRLFETSPKSHVEPKKPLLCTPVAQLGFASMSRNDFDWKPMTWE